MLSCLMRKYCCAIVSTKRDFFILLIGFSKVVFPRGKKSVDCGKEFVSLIHSG